MDYSTTRNDGITRLGIFLVLASLTLHCWGQQSATRSNQKKMRSEAEPQPQPDNVMSGEFDDMRRDDGWLCTRECRPGDNRLCYYLWMIEPYDTVNRACGNCPNVTSDCFLPQCVSADGFEKAIFVVNRRLPGPSIQVCKGDTVVVDVVNEMPGRSTTIHWHGLHQKGTPWMDGVPYVTQCPIHEAETFRYRFRTDESGTSFWHSHDGLQKVDGVLGSLIVREPDSENPLRSLYDFDLPSHVVIFEDWMHTPADERFPGFFRYREQGQHPATYLINGRGATVVNKTVFESAPLSEFTVRQGYRYRFRLIGASCLSCPYQFTIQDHKMRAIATDRNPIEPLDNVDYVVLSAGERYDVVIEAMQPIDAYWMYVQGLGDCTNFSQVAVLRYEGGPSRPSVPLSVAIPDDGGFTLNTVQGGCDDESLAIGRCISQLTGLRRTPPEVTRPVADVRILLTFDFYIFENEELFYSGTYHDFFVAPTGVHVAGQMNNRSHASPPSPLLTQLYDIPPDMFCQNADCSPDGSRVCDCTYVIRVPLNAVVEFMLVHSELPNEFMLVHPFHIHGHDFYVIEEGRLPDTYYTPEGMAFVQQKLNEERLNLKSHLPMKDTVSILSQGYSIHRITTNNPGFWFFHCHFAYHQETGMAVVIWAGEYDEVVPPPPGFPKCGDFLTEPLQPLPNPRTFRTF